MKRTDFIQMMADVLETEPAEIVPQAELSDFPLYGSVCALMLMMKLEGEAGVACSPDDLAALKTIGDVESLICRQVGIEA
jgi:acyl carrier protein